MRKFARTCDPKTEVTWWDYQWDYSRWTNNGLAIVPNVNLVENIGFGAQATHTAIPTAGLLRLGPMRWNSPSCIRFITSETCRPIFGISDGCCAMPYIPAYPGYFLLNKPNNMLYIVIPVFNRIEFTKKCLDSLRKQSFTSFRVIVVDDGSTDGTAEILTGQYPEVIVLDGGGDLYWTAAVNIGIRYALEQHATHIMTLNNDTIAPVEFLQSMVKSAESVPGSILGAVEVNWATKLVHYGGEELNGGASGRFFIMKC
jgi:hypothetical protein